MAEPVTELHSDTAVTVGRILGAHGVRGEVKVQPLSDIPARFNTGARLWVNGTACRIERSRWQGRGLILKLEGVDDRNTAEALRGADLLVPEPAPLPDEGIYYLHDILGMTAVDRSGEILGRVADVLSTGSNDVYVIEGERGQLLVPALDDIVVEVDVKARRLVLELVEGLEFQGARRTGGTAPRKAAGKAPGATQGASTSAGPARRPRAAEAQRRNRHATPPG